jgi:hypothetical protein
LPLDVGFRENTKDFNASPLKQRLTFANLSGTLSDLGKALWQTDLFRKDIVGFLPRHLIGNTLRKLVGWTEADPVWPVVDPFQPQADIAEVIALVGQ